MNAEQVLDDAVSLFEVGMGREEFLDFISSGECDLMKWTRKNHPDFVRILTNER